MKTLEKSPDDAIVPKSVWNAVSIGLSSRSVLGPDFPYGYDATNVMIS